jgi:hypothetical protein
MPWRIELFPDPLSPIRMLTFALGSLPNKSRVDWMTAARSGKVARPVLHRAQIFRKNMIHFLSISRIKTDIGKYMYKGTKLLFKSNTYGSSQLLVLMTKNRRKKIQIWSKIAIYSCPAYRRSLQPSKENIHNFKKEIY